MSAIPCIDAELDLPPTNEELGWLQFTTMLYRLQVTNSNRAPAIIPAIGMALATILVVVERGVIMRECAAKITVKLLRYLMECPQGPKPDASGYSGFFYHFLDIETGRVWQCELSTVDSAFLFAGALSATTYFDGDPTTEGDIRRLAALYERADWQWACDGGATLTHSWRPEIGFIVSLAPRRLSGSWLH